jgi:hypothetical protein
MDKGGTGGADSIFEANPVFTLPDTVSITTWYIVIKAGCRDDAAGDVTVNFSMLFDDVSLFDYGDTPLSLIYEMSSVNDLFTLFPNPSDGLVNILTEDRNLKYEVYNKIGALVNSGFYDGSAIDLRNMN